MAHLLVEALIPYPCVKNGRQMVAGVGDHFELHAFAARTAQRRRQVKIIGGSQTQKQAIRRRAEIEAEAKEKAAAKAAAKAAKNKK